MDITSLLSTLTNSDSLSGLAQTANVSADSAKSILSSALPNLLSGALSQAQDGETAEGFANALTQHAASDTSSVSSFLSGVDLSDGGKILSHLLGGKTDSTVSEIAESSGATAEQTSTVLSAASSMLMSLLGQQTSSEQAAGTGIADIMGSLMGGSDVSGILSGLLGGGTSAAEDTLNEIKDTAAEAAAAATEAASGAASEAKASGLLGLLGKLFGGK